MELSQDLHDVTDFTVHVTHYSEQNSPVDHEYWTIDMRFWVGDRSLEMTIYTPSGLDPRKVAGLMALFALAGEVAEGKK